MLNGAAVKSAIDIILSDSSLFHFWFTKQFFTVVDSCDIRHAPTGLINSNQSRGGFSVADIAIGQRPLFDLCHVKC